MTTSNKTNWVDLGFKLLSLLFLPLFGLGVSMYTEASLTRERVSQIQHQQDEAKTQIEAVNTRINQIALTVQDTNGQIHELRTVIEIIRDQVSHAGNRP
jgi:septal ring factor EnvC (AmiA/AmiB activator)